MIRVLHIINSPNFGGIERLVFDLIKIQNKNPELNIALFITFPKGELIKDFENTGIECYSGNFTSGYDVHLSKLKRVLEIFKKHDILHFHSFNPVLAFLAMISKKVVFYTEHGNFGFGRKMKINDRIKFFLLNIYLNHFVSFVSFNSKFIKSIARKKYGLKRVPNDVIYNGIDFSKECIQSIGIDRLFSSQIDRKFIIGTTSRFAGFKRIDRLIEAFSIFQNGKNAALLLVGDGILLTELKSQVHNLGISDKVIFTGYRKNITDYQQAMDVCVFPSQNEPFGLVAVETMSLGKPVIVFSDGGGIVEIVGDKFPDDVVDSIQGLVERLNHFYNLGKESCETISSRINYSMKFDIKLMEEAICKRYKKILACVE